MVLRIRGQLLRRLLPYPKLLASTELLARPELLLGRWLRRRR